MADVLGAIRDPLPDDALRMLDWLATEHEDPAREEWQEDAGGGQAYYNGDILLNGINTTRGQAADAVRDLILADAACIDRLRPHPRTDGPGSERGGTFMRCRDCSGPSSFTIPRSACRSSEA